jgi:hypothetical protein
MLTAIQSMNIQGQAGVTLGAGAIVSTNNSLQINTNANGAAVAIGANAVVTSGNGMQISANGSNSGVTIGANAQLNGGTGLQINANNQNSAVTVGAGAQLTAGVLNGTPAFGAMTQANILKNGGINIQVQGGGGQGLSLLGAATFTANGGGIQVNSIVPVGGLVYPNGTVFTANGGNIQISLTSSGIVAPSSLSATIQASTLNGGNGTVQISSQSTLAMGSGSTINGMSSIQINVNNGAFTFAGSAISTSGSLNIFGQSGVTVGTGSVVTVTSGSQLQFGNSVGSITVGDNAAISSVNGSVTMQSPGNLSIGTGSTVSGATGVTLGAASQSSTLTILGSIMAGSFISPATPFGPVQSYQVKTSGSVNVVASGSGGLLFQPSSTEGISSIGGNVTLSSNGPGNNIIVGDGIHAAKVVAHGGSVQMNASGQVTLNALANINASTINGQQGNLNISANQGLTVQPVASMTALAAIGINSSSVSFGGVLTAGSTAALSSSGSFTIGNAATLSSGNTLSLSQSNGSAVLNIGPGAQFVAGQLLNDTGAGVINTQAVTIAKSGSIIISASGTGGVFIGQGVSMISNAGDVSVIANGNIVLDSSSAVPATQTVLQANGGNVLVMSQRTISQSSGASTGNTFIARAIGTSSNNTSGGGIQLSSGTTSAQVQGDLSKPAGSQPLLLSMIGLGAANISNTNGAIVANVQGGGVVNLAGAGSASTLTLNRGAMHFDAIGASSAVTINQGSFQTFGFRPVSFVFSAAPEIGGDESASAQQETKVVEGKVDAVGGRLRNVKPLKILSEPDAEFAQDIAGRVHLRNGRIFLDASTTLVVHTKFADVYANKSALVQVSIENGNVSVRACSGIRDVSVVLAGNRIDLCSGQEVIVTESVPGSSDLLPQDGIGRRHQQTYPLPGGLHVTVSDFSLVSAIVNTSKLTELKHSVVPSDQRLLKRLIRSAAAVDVVMRSKGIYKSTPKPQQLIDGTRYTEAYGTRKLKLPASEYYSSALP